MTEIGNLIAYAYGRAGTEEQGRERKSLKARVKDFEETTGILGYPGLSFHDLSILKNVRKTLVDKTSNYDEVNRSKILAGQILYENPKMFSETSLEQVVGQIDNSEKVGAITNLAGKALENGYSTKIQEKYTNLIIKSLGELNKENKDEFVDALVQALSVIKPNQDLIYYKEINQGLEDYSLLSKAIQEVQSRQLNRETFGGLKGVIERLGSESEAEGMTQLIASGNITALAMYRRVIVNSLYKNLVEKNKIKQYISDNTGKDLDTYTKMVSAIYNTNKAKQVLEQNHDISAAA